VAVLGGRRPPCERPVALRFAGRARRVRAGPARWLVSVPSVTDSSASLRSVADRAVLVTGAASGMGSAIARLFAEEGARVAALDRDREGLAAVVEGIGAGGGRGTAVVADLADRSGIAVAVAEAEAAVGPIDVLVNDAGVSLPAPIGAGGYEVAWATTMAVNLEAQARLVRASLASLARAGEGQIVNVASTEGLGATAGLSPYTVSKHGVVGLTRALAVELGPRGVTVNCVCPGPIHTKMTEVIPDEHKARFARRRVPLRRYGEPEEVAHVVLSLAQPGASFVTGAIIPVDGGLVAMNG